MTQYLMSRVLRALAITPMTFDTLREMMWDVDRLDVLRAVNGLSIAGILDKRGDRWLVAPTPVDVAWIAMRVYHDQDEPLAENHGEVWQYMGVADGMHEFRHRCHAERGRVVWRTPAA